MILSCKRLSYNGNPFCLVKCAVNYYIHEKHTTSKITCVTYDKLKSSTVHFTCKTKYFLGFFHGDNFLSMSGLPLRYVMLLKIVMSDKDSE